MKKSLILGICITTLVAVAAWVPNVLAFQNGSNCAECHDWLSVSHPNHQTRTGCSTCHIGIPTPVRDVADSCSNCHEPQPLQINHVLSYGVAVCGDCHAIPECTVDEECDDGVGCTVDTCDGGVCANTPDNTICDDDNVCNGDETCDPVGGCQAGTPLICDDMNLCTTDSCDPATGCLYTPVECLPGELCDPADGMCKEVGCTSDAECDDGMFCNGAETCDVASGNCIAGTPPDCDDGIDCTVDTCDEVNDMCANTPDNTICDDDDVCNGDETCDPVGGCQPGTPLICDDMNLCTTDSCDAVTGCLYTPVECLPGELCDPADGMCKEVGGCMSDDQCDDGMFCNGAETCDVASGNCMPGTPPDCDDGIDCTVDTCDEVNDMCANTPDDTVCPDDGMFCTGQEICDPASGCISAGDPCPEGMTCNEDTDTCDMVGGKVTICHIPPGNHSKARTLSISANAVSAHLAHGDFLGPCPE